jgi:hypothetical protein
VGGIGVCVGGGGSSGFGVLVGAGVSVSIGE